VGRQLQESYGQEAQVIITVPLLEGLDGVNKMSKSLGNYIGIAESADVIFGKVMSISDQLMWRYFELLSFRPLAEIAGLKTAIEAGKNPRDVKFELARELVARFHGAAAAEQAQRDFTARFAEKALPTDLPPTSVPVGPDGIRIANLLKEGGLAASTSEANRKIDEGAVKVDGVKIADRALMFRAGADHIFQIGSRRIARLALVARPAEG
jgi:tyrosyl-tRNA synthetase